MPGLTTLRGSRKDSVMLEQQTQVVVKPRRIGRRGAVRWVTVGVLTLASVGALAGCNQSGAPALEDPSAEELAQQREQNAELQRQIDDLEEQQDEQEKADLQEQIDDLNAQQEEQKQQENQPQQDREAAEKKEQPSSEEGPGPAPGYNLIQTADGSLSAEVPPSWGVETGEDSEKEAAGPGSWSYFVGEYLFSSITTAPSLEVWYSGEQGSSGAYFVAARVLAQYSDYEITHSLFNASKAETCAEEGPYDDYERPPYSGKLQTWYGCGPDGATVYTLAAYPEGRECVVALNARISDEADREAIEHLVDTVEVDCGRVTSGPLALSSTSASASASASATPEATTTTPESSAPASESASASPCPNLRVTPDGLQCSNLPDVIPGAAEPSPNSPNPNTPGSAPPDSGSGGRCPQGGHWVGIDGPGDGDSDGCAGE